MSFSWAWRASKHLDAPFKLRAKFVLEAIRQRSLARVLAAVDSNSALGSVLAERPETIGALIWPYQCAAWTAHERFDRIASHFETASQISGLQLSADEKLVLQDLSWISPGVFLMLDSPTWLAREGHLTLSLFKNEFRAFTLSFSLLNRPQLEVFIGGIQGRQNRDILSLYRDLTKDFHGMRPRDFLVEAFRLFAIQLGAKRILAVADAQKISRHPYFGAKGAPGLYYDEIWEERGGIRVADTHFELPLGGNRRNLEEISSKKRSMYRRRYEMLDQIAANMPMNLNAAKRRRFKST